MADGDGDVDVRKSILRNGESCLALLCVAHCYAVLCNTMHGWKSGRCRRVYWRRRSYQQLPGMLQDGLLCPIKSLGNKFEIGAKYGVRTGCQINVQGTHP